jgi:hypothetical protein
MLTEIDIIELIPEEKRGDVQKFFDTKKEGLINLSEVQTKDQVIDILKKNSNFDSVFQRELTLRNQAYQENFKSDKLPDLLNTERENIRKELNPSETEEQKRIRELEDRIKAQESEKKLFNLQGELRNTAKEANIPQLIAEELAYLGEEKARQVLSKVSNEWNSTINQLAEKYKGSGNADPGGAKTPTEGPQSTADYLGGIWPTK